MVKTVIVIGTLATAGVVALGAWLLRLPSPALPGSAESCASTPATAWLLAAVLLVVTLALLAGHVLGRLSQALQDGRRYRLTQRRAAKARPASAEGGQR